ncbi:hypothetical protein U91I_02714 [alpha proteobacterium U9-1i]|nr:hypothetical protein U91I_02714 [alpha proteobacterium U9-1i]
MDTAGRRRSETQANGHLRSQTREVGSAGYASPLPPLSSVRAGGLAPHFGLPWPDQARALVFPRPGRNLWPQRRGKFA